MISHQNTLGHHLLPRTGILAHPRWRNATLLIAGVELLTICGHISFPLPTTPVPITLQTFGILLIAALLGPRLGTATILAYLGAGLAGLPVFALGRNAWSPSSIPTLPVIIGPTAGYLYAFPLVGIVVGTLATRGWDRKLGPAIITMLLGNLIILGCGFAWLLIITSLVKGNIDIPQLLALTVVPFLLGDALKIGLAAMTLPGGWALLGTTPPTKR